MFISGRLYHLVGGLEHVLFSHILGIIIPIDFHIFSGVLKPPTISIDYISIDDLYINRLSIDYL